MKQSPSNLIFLPGALGRNQLWDPVSNLIKHPGQKTHIEWPGFGGKPSDPFINGINDLATMVANNINQPTAIIAQSMGGVIAIKVALEKPGYITHLVLAATSGGIDLTSLGAQDWRTSLYDSHPELPNWFYKYQEDLTNELRNISIPTLLLWGDSDPISPVCVGEKIRSIMNNAFLHVSIGGDHDLAETHAPTISRLIDYFLWNSEIPAPPNPFDRIRI